MKIPINLNHNIFPWTRNYLFFQHEKSTRNKAPIWIFPLKRNIRIFDASHHANIVVSRVWRGENEIGKWAGNDSGSADFVDDVEDDGY